MAEETKLLTNEKPSEQKKFLDCLQLFASSGRQAKVKD